MQVNFLHPGIYKGNGPLGSAIVCRQQGLTLTLRSRYQEGYHRSSACRRGGINPIATMVCCVVEIYHEPDEEHFEEWWSVGGSYAITTIDPILYPGWECQVALLSGGGHYEQPWWLETGKTEIYDSFYEWGDPCAAAVNTIDPPPPQGTSAAVAWTEEGDPTCSS